MGVLSTTTVDLTMSDLLDHVYVQLFAIANDREPVWEDVRDQIAQSIMHCIYRFKYIPTADDILHLIRSICKYEGDLCVHRYVVDGYKLYYSFNPNKYEDKISNGFRYTKVFDGQLYRIHFEGICLYFKNDCSQIEESWAY